MNGKPSRVFTINIGGNLMTKDLSIGLGVSFEEAERIKVASGLSESRMPLNWEVRNIQGQICQLDPLRTFEILKSRIMELSELIKKEIAPFGPLLQGGIILTGGGSEVLGISTVFQSVLKMPVEKIDPVFKCTSNLSSSSKLSSKYATVLGLLHQEYTMKTQISSSMKAGPIGGSFLKLVNWVKEIYE